MGVGLYLNGTVHDGGQPETWLESAGDWFRDAAEPVIGHAVVGTGYQDRPTLFVGLHPTAEDLELFFSEPGRLVASAKTSTTGPGYHRYLCRLLHQFGQARGVSWDPPAADGDTGDETGFFHTGDAAAVDREMLKWLRSISGWVIQSLGEDYASFMICMPLGYSYPHEDEILTPTGPRDIGWFRAADERPEEHTDFFPWWGDDFDADFYLARAKYRMWVAVRWRPPFTDAEWNVDRAVLSDLESAYRLDPDRAYPWREWDELLENVLLTGEFEDDDLPPDELRTTIRRRAAEDDSGGRLIGYRRRPVRVRPGDGWSIVIPGEMAEQWEENAWNAWDGRRTIWLTTLTFRSDAPLPPQQGLERLMGDDRDGEAYEHTAGSLVGTALWRPYEEDGQSLWNLAGYSTAEGAAAICNIYVEDPNDREWALDTWRSLTAPAKNDGTTTD